MSTMIDIIGWFAIGMIDLGLGSLSAQGLA